jgi:uncharacterized membrane protein YfcA
MRERLVNWFFGAISVLLLMALAFLGWLKWLLSALFFLGGAVFGYIGIKALVGSKEKSNQPTLVSLMLLGVAILLLTFAVLLSLGIIEPSLD